MMSTCPSAPKAKKTEARRHQDAYWTWPKCLSFMGSEEFLMLPVEIRHIVFQYLVEESAWEP